MTAISDVFTKFMSLMEADIDNGGLGVTTILGFPELGRVEQTAPMAALVMERAGYSGQGGQKKRLGAPEPLGTECTASLYVFAEDEFGLLSLTDTMLSVAHNAGGFRMDDNTPIGVKYGQIQRANMSNDPSERTYVVMNAITFSWK